MDCENHFGHLEKLLRLEEAEEIHEFQQEFLNLLSRPLPQIPSGYRQLCRKYRNSPEVLLYSYIAQRTFKVFQGTSRRARLER